MSHGVVFMVKWQFKSETIGLGRARGRGNGKKVAYTNQTRHIYTCTHTPHSKWIYKMMRNENIHTKKIANALRILLWIKGLSSVLKYEASDVLLLGRDVRMKTDYCIELHDPSPPPLAMYILYVCFADTKCATLLPLYLNCFGATHWQRRGVQWVYACSSMLCTLNKLIIKCALL